MGLKVVILRLPDGLPGAYTEFVEDVPPSMLVSSDLPHEEQEALEVEGNCYQLRGPRTKRQYCYPPRDIESLDRERVRALRRCVEQERPEWVERVKWACRIDNVAHKIISYSGVPPYPAYAILLNLVERGELSAGQEGEPDGGG